jgi:adenosylhomocysteinase
MKYDVKDLALAEKGELRMEWARQNMPVLMAIQKRFEKEKPLNGVRVSACLHVTTETANLMLVLQAGGADVQLCASNPLSTQDDVAAALVKNHNIPTFAIKGEDNETYYQHILDSLSHGPHLTMEAWRRKECCSIRSSLSMMPTPSTCLTIVMAPDRARLMESFAQQTH